MTNLTITLDEAKFSLVEQAARNERKSVSAWLVEHVVREAQRTLETSRLAELARLRGYPADWIGTMGSAGDDPTFALSVRGAPRVVSVD